jgi:hypothetical protein
MENKDQPFAELPEALVEEALSKSEDVGKMLYKSFQELHDNKEKVRNQLLNKRILKRDSELVSSDIPTTCGVDGSYAVERLLAIDLVACAGVAVEGIVPPSEKRFWENPRHKVFIQPQTHNPDTSVIVRGLMMEMEMELAVKAPHDIVFLDGSFSTPLIYMNQAVNSFLGNPNLEVGKKLEENFDAFISSYKEILKSKRSDKLWVSVPKYTTKRELGEEFKWPSNYDDRAVLTTILNSGEFTLPVPIDSPQQPWHLKFPDGKTATEFDSLLKNIYVIYYKPYKWIPALRLEIAPSAATNLSQIGVLLQGIRTQCVTPGMLEPYPLYLADRMVKHLSKALPSFRQAATRKMMELQQDEDVSEIFFGMHGYRTDT